MDLLSLNDDVLFSIFSHLDAEDALHVSLACKRAYLLAIARVASVAQCWSPTQLRRLYDYHLSPDPFIGFTRARYLENLSIHATALGPQHLFSESQGQEVHDLEFQDFSQAHLVGELLQHAQNIRSISLDRFDALIKKQPRIPLAFSSMHQLARVQLLMIGDGTLDSLRCLRNPKRLTLSYHTRHDGPLDDPLDESKTIPSLLIALVPFRNLHTVDLWNFTPPHPEDPAALPLLPSVHYLRLYQSSVPALDMVQLCPNLSTLQFSLSMDFDAGDIVASHGPRWRPLRRIMLDMPREAVCVVDRVRKVNLLQVLGVLQLDATAPLGDSGGLPQFLDLLRAASPVGLHASLGVGTGGFSPLFWKDLTSCAPRMHSLELKLYDYIHQSGEDDDRLTRQLPNALSNTSLLVLKMLVPATPRPWHWGSDYANARALAEAKARERDRVRALAAVPRALVNAISSLRYLFVADMAPNPVLADDPPVESEDDSTDTTTKGTGDVYECDEFRRIYCMRKKSWWKIIEDEGARKMVEISEAEGERAQHIVEDGDFEGTSQIEEALASLSF